MTLVPGARGCHNNQVKPVLNNKDLPNYLNACDVDLVLLVVSRLSFFLISSPAHISGLSQETRGDRCRNKPHML